MRRTDQAAAFPIRGSNQPVRQLPPPRNTTPTAEHSSRTEARPADNAGRVLSSRHAPRYSSPLLLLLSSPPPPADNAGEAVLAHSSKLAPIDWHSCKPLNASRMDGQQNASRPDGGSQDTYEDRTLEIMQHIWQLSDNYDRLHAQAGSLQPYPEANYQRLNQLYTPVRNAIDELRHDCTQHSLAMDAWDVLATVYLSEDSTWSRKMLQHRRSFFENPAFIPKRLDEKQMDLLEYYCRIQQRIEDLTQQREEAARAAHSRAPLADNATGHGMRSDAEQQSAAIRLGTQLNASEDPHRHRSAKSDARSHRDVLSKPKLSPTRAGWHAARGGACHRPQRPQADNASGVAPSSDLAADNAACHPGGSGPPQDRVKTMMSSFAPSAAAGRGPSMASSRPLQVGADGKPFSGRNAEAKQPSSASGTADFGHESTSAFYRNASYHRNAAPPPFTLKAPAIAPFQGDIRAYPTFRNHFLEVIEAQPGLEPRHKLQYLLQFLRDEPYSLANRYLITDDNYFRVLDRLEERYGDQRNLCCQLAQLLLALPSPSEAVPDLRRFYDECDRLLSEMRQNGEDPDTSTMFSQTLLSKLPQPVRFEVIRRAERNVPTTAVILEKLHDYLRILEAANLSLNLSNSGQHGRQCRLDPRSYSRDPPSRSQRPNRYDTYMADAEVINAKCPLCAGPHWPSQCPRYDTTGKRLRRVLKLKFCLLCLKGGHRAGLCPKKSGLPCRYCGHGEHHRALCKELWLRGKELRPDPMSATTKEQFNRSQGDGFGRMPGAPDAPASPARERELNGTVEHDSSAALKGPDDPQRSVQQEARELSVARAGVPGSPPAKIVRFPSTPHSSRIMPSNSKTPRETKPKDSRTDPKGLEGTTSPMAKALAKSMIPKDDANLSGDLPLHQTRLRTDRCSTQDKMMQPSRLPGHDLGGMPGVPSTAEDFLPDHPSGQLVGTELRGAPVEPTPRFAKEHRREDEATSLLECLLTTAKNPFTDDSCDAVVVFDRRRTTSLVTKELVRVLKLPATSTPTADFPSFTGFKVCLDLLSAKGFKLSLDDLDTGRLPHLVRTVLVDEKLLVALRRNQQPLDVIYAQPHLLIGLDVMTRIQYRHGPRLRDDLFSVHTLLGVALGGRLEAEPDSLSEVSTSSRSGSSAWTDSEADSAKTTSRPIRFPSPPTQEPPISRSHLRHQEFAVGPPADNAAGSTAHFSDRSPYHPADNAGGTASYATYEHLETSTTTHQVSRQSSSLSRVTDAQSPSTQPQLPTNPLDTQPLLLPIPSTIQVDVEEVSRADNATEPPRPIQEPFRLQPDQRHAAPPPTPQGQPIRSNYGGSSQEKKTRLRQFLPECALHILGIYAAQEPVSTVLPACSVSLLQAEQQLQPHPNSPPQCPVVPCSSTAFRACTVTDGFHPPTRQQTDAANGLRMFAPTGSRHEIICGLRSSFGLPAHARTACEQQPSGPAHQQPPARNAHIADASPQPCGSQHPAQPPPATRPASPPRPPSSFGRVRVDPRPAAAAWGPEDAINHSTQRLSALAACVFSSSTISQRLGVCISRVRSASSRIGLCLIRTISAFPTNMGKRKTPKTTTYGNPAEEDYDSDDPGVIASDDGGPPRVLRSSEVQGMVVGTERDRLLAVHQLDNEPSDTGQGSSVPADNAGLQASATGSGAKKAEKPADPADNAGSKGKARPQSSKKADKSSSGSSTPSSQSRLRVIPRTPSSDKPPSKAKTPATPPKSARHRRTPSPAEEQADLEQMYTIAEAIRLLNEPTTAQTEAEFRQEVENFYKNWCHINRKSEQRTPDAWSDEWKYKHKLGHLLYARYRKFYLGIVARHITASRDAASSTATPAAQSSDASSDPQAQADPQQLPATDAATTDPQPTAVSSTTDVEMSEDTALEGPIEPMPELTDKDLEILNTPMEADQQVDDFLCGKFEAMLDEADQEEDTATQPPPCPADNAGTEGEAVTGTADNAAPSAGTVGQAVEVPSVRPPAARTASSSQSETGDRSRQQSTKRLRTHAGDSKDPPAQRVRHRISLSPDRLSPGIERHRRTHKNSEQLLSPILDPRVYKDSAAKLTLLDEPFAEWTPEFRNENTEYIGYINGWQAPWTYLPADAYKHRPLQKAHHLLAEITMDHVLKEDIRLPNRYVVGHTFGIDPNLHKMVTSETRQYLTFIAKQKYWEPAPGVKLRVVGIGPTGFQLRDCKNYNDEFIGQSNAFARLARAADEAGKCLSIRMDKDNGTDIDLHDAAREILRHIKFHKETPIYLQEHQGGYEDLCGWLEEYPTTVISFDFWYLDFLEGLVEQFKATPNTPLYIQAVGLFEFCKLVPLANLAIQSGAYTPKGDSVPRQPNEILAAASLLQRLTGTPAAVYIEQTARNAARVYQLNAQLLDRAKSTPDTRRQPRCTIENLRRTIDTQMLNLGLAPAPRADQDQGPSGRHSSLGLPADNAGGQLGAGVETLSLPSAAERSKSASRSPHGRSPKDRAEDNQRKSRSPMKRDKKKTGVKTDKPDKDTKASEQRPHKSSSRSGSSATGSSRKQADPKPKSKTSPKRRSRSRTPPKRHSRSRSRSPTRPSPSASLSRRSSYRTESASRRNDSDRSRDKQRSGRSLRYYEYDLRDDQERRREEDPWRPHERRPGSDRREEERRRLERLREEDRRERRERDQAESPDRSAANKGRDKSKGGSSSRSSSGTPTPAIKFQVFVKPNTFTKPQNREPVRPPSRDTQESRGSSRNSSLASTSTQRSHADRLRDRVMIPSAVAPADNAAAPYRVIQRKNRRPADNAGAGLPLRRTTPNDLLKPHPLPARWTLRPSEEEVEQYVEGFFSDQIDESSQLRPFYLNDFASAPIDPAQQDSFSVPPEESWHPEKHCGCTGNEPDFHLTIEQANYIPIRRWRAHKAFKGPGRDEKLNEIGATKIFTYGHMILVTWAGCLKGKDDRIVHVVEFLHRVLRSFDFEQEIPDLLAEFQELMTTEDSRSKWPAYKDQKIGAERWACCCPKAFRYIFNRLSGPIDWTPQWLQSDAVPEECRAIARNDMLVRAEEMFNELRHVIYRQYGLRHIQAAVDFEDFFWKRFDNDRTRETHRDGVCINVHTIIFAEEPVVTAFGAGLRDTVRMLPIPDGNRDATRKAVLRYFPGPEVRRVVFWLGRNYIVENNHDDYDKLIMELSHIYAIYLGYLEQFVVLPPYARTHDVNWVFTALRLHMEREDLLQFARVALYPVDLQYYDRDQRLGTDATWPPQFGTTEDGRYRHAGTITGRKQFLREKHGLDLWKESTKSTASKQPPTLDYSNVPRTDAADNAAPAMRPTTSANIAAKPRTAADPPPADNAAGRTSQSASTTQPLSLEASTSVQAPCFAPILSNAVSAFLQQQAQDFQAFQQALLAQIANQQAASTEQPKEQKSRHRDQKHDRRK